MDDSIQLQLSPKGLCDRGSIAYQNVELFNFGQGFISFGIFGLDIHLTILSFKRRYHCLCVTLSTTVVNKYVTGEKDGRKRESKRFVPCAERWNRRLEGGEEQPAVSSLCCHLRPG